MPGGDRTGPWGAGPMTGRGGGFCAGYNMPGYLNPTGGRGFGAGRGRGMGRGHRHMYYATGQPGWMRGAGYSGWDMPQPMPMAATARFSEKDELRYLKEQAGHLGEMLEDVNQRIGEIEKSRSSKGVE